MEFGKLQKQVGFLFRIFELLNFLSSHILSSVSYLAEGAVLGLKQIKFYGELYIAAPYDILDFKIRELHGEPHSLDNFCVFFSSGQGMLGGFSTSAHYFPY